MSVLIDGQPVATADLPAGITVGELTDWVKGALEGRNAILFGIRCDGEEVSTTRLDEVMSRSLGEFEQLEFVSGFARDVVLDVLEESRRCFVESFANVKQAAEDMAAGNIAQGMAELVECVGIWSNVHEAIVNGGALVGIDFDRLVIGGRHILDWLKDLNTRLREIKNAVESRDNVLLGDILRYEMDETLGGWENMLNGFIEHVRGIDEIVLADSRPPAAETA